MQTIEQTILMSNPQVNADKEQLDLNVPTGTSIVNSEEKPQLLNESAMKENPENSMSASLVDYIFIPAISSPVNPQSEVPCLPHTFYVHLVIGMHGAHVPSLSLFCCLYCLTFFEGRA